MTKRTTDNDRSTKLAVGIGLAAASAGAFMLRRSIARHKADGEVDIDAPHYVLDRPGARPVAGTTLLIGKPRQELFDAWQPDRFPAFMDDVVRATTESGNRWTMVIKAPAGHEVTLRNRITEQEDGRSISWQSEDDSEIANSGKVSFRDAPTDRGTFVTLVTSYDPPGGVIGKTVAKLLGREPEVQTSRNLRRFKQLMETGEVTTNASPADRDSSPVEPHL